MICFSHCLSVFGAPSGGEILLILLVLLLLFGSKNLPKMARTLGRTLDEFRRAAKEVSDEIMHADPDTPSPQSKALPHTVAKKSDEKSQSYDYEDEEYDEDDEVDLQMSGDDIEQAKPSAPSVTPPEPSEEEDRK